MTHRSDPNLIRACLAGDARAWEELVERYGRLVWSIPRRYGLPDADAEEVHQSVFVTLFEKLGQLEDATRLSSWLITTTHRTCWRVGRRRATTAAELDARIADVGAPDPAEAAAWEERHLVRLALDRLGGRCAKLLRMLFSTERPDYERVAGELGMKVGSIGPTRARCFGKLEPILRELGLGDDDPDRA